jgi:aquaporin Z
MINAIIFATELLATFLFISSILISGGQPLVIGAALALLVYISAPISGGALNPAVSIASYMSGKIFMSEFLIYMFAQLLGGVGAALAYKYVYRTV